MRRIAWTHYAAPQTFYGLAGVCWKPLALLALALALAGMWVGFMVAPADAQQGEGYRIIFVHVPVSWMSMIIYLAMAFWGVVCLVFRARMAGMLSQALAPTGALFAFLSLWTGALWGKPMWGAWWVWDARLTSMFVLMLLYIGYMAIWAAIEEPHRAAMVARIVALVGFVNVPIVKFSVDWWNTLHQGASVSLTKSPTMASTMLWGMLIMSVAFWLYSIAAVLTRVRSVILERERNADWVRQLGENA